MSLHLACCCRNNHGTFHEVLSRLQASGPRLHLWSHHEPCQVLILSHEHCGAELLEETNSCAPTALAAFCTRDRTISHAMRMVSTPMVLATPTLGRLSSLLLHPLQVSSMSCQVFAASSLLHSRITICCCHVLRCASHGFSTSCALLLLHKALGYSFWSESSAASIQGSFLAGMCTPAPQQGPWRTMIACLSSVAH